MNDRNDSDATQVARDYYNSTNADLFYREVWGGEDILVGLYRSEDESIAAASRRTVERMVKLTEPWTSETRVIDLGAGYGGSMRDIAERFGSRCAALNLSDLENEGNVRMNHEAGLHNRIDVFEGDFASLDPAQSAG